MSIGNVVGLRKGTHFLERDSGNDKFVVQPSSSGNGQPEDDWFMFRHDMNRTGNSSSTTPNTNDTLWIHQVPQAQASYGYCSSPSIVNGTVYQGSIQPNLLRAINATTGIQKWERPVGGSVTSSPTVCNNRVLFTCYDKKIYSVFEETGLVDWSQDLQSDVVTDGSPVVYEGKVYVGCGQGDYISPVKSLLFCLNETNGDIIWTFQADGQIPSSPTVVDDHVIFGSLDGNVYALPTDDPNDDGTVQLSEIIWKFELGAQMASSPAVENGVVYMGAWDDTLYALPLRDPNGDGIIDSDEVIWTFTTSNDIWSSAAVANGRVFIGSLDCYLYALPEDDPNGDGVIAANEVLWTFLTSSSITGSPAVAGGKVFVGSENHRLWAINEETGEHIWDYRMPLQSEPGASGLLYSSPSVGDGRVIIGNFDLKLYCFGNDDEVPPTIVSSGPTGITNVTTRETDIEIVFDEELCEGLFTNRSVVVRSDSGKIYTGDIIYNGSAKSARFSPHEEFFLNERHTVRLRSRYIQDNAGNPLDGNFNGFIEGSPADDYCWEFTLVNDAPRLTDANITPADGDLGTEFEYRITYTDLDNNTPEIDPAYIEVYLDGEPIGRTMTVDLFASPPLRDGNFLNGERYCYKTRFWSYGNHTFQFKCTDGVHLNSTPVYSNPRIWSPQTMAIIPDQTAVEDVDFVLDLTNDIYDKDTKKRDLILTENSSYATVKGLNITFHYPNSFNFPSGRRHEMVLVSVFDPATRYEIFQDIRVDVLPVNDPPRISSIPVLKVYEGMRYDLDVSSFIMDDDNEVSELTIGTNSSYATVTDTIISFFYPVNSEIQYDHIRITVFDGVDYDHLNVSVVVIPKGVPFVLLPIPSMMAMEDIDLIVDITEYIEILGNLSINDLDFEIDSIYGIISGTDIVFNYPNSFNYPYGSTREYVRLNVTWKNYTLSQTIRIDVKPVNDGPTLSVDSPLKSATANESILFKARYFDMDGGENPLVAVVINGTEYAMDPTSGNIHLDGGIYGLELAFPVGVYEYYFRADDGENVSNSVVFTEKFNLSVIEHTDLDGGGEDGTEKKENRDMIIFWLGIMIIIVLAVLIIFVFFKRKRTRGKVKEVGEHFGRVSNYTVVDTETDEGEENPTRVKAGVRELSELVALEDEKEVLLVRIDRVYGRLEQVDWDLEDGDISKKRYNALVGGLEKKVEQLEDELDRIEGRITRLEIRIRRKEHRKTSKKRMYGGGEADDFHEDSYSADDEWEENDYMDFWDDDDSWVDEPEDPGDDDFIDYED